MSETGSIKGQVVMETRRKEEVEKKKKSEGFSSGSGSSSFANLTFKKKKMHVKKMAKFQQLVCAWL